MCGIAGYFSTSNEFDQTHLEGMAGRIRHRGPDADGFYTSGFAGLAHRRLSIIDLSTAANQPMRSSDGRYAMVFNGEVYNYREIAEKIKAAEPGFTAITHSDSEIILEAFRLWGYEFTMHLNGMFAIAIYDEVKKCIWLFRDRMGIKPLYFILQNQNLLFASEIKALVPLLKQKKINPNALADYFFLEYIPGTQTIFTEITKLGAGQYLYMDSMSSRLEYYYRAENHTGQTNEKDEAYYLTGLKEELEKSLRYQTISDVPLGAFLSGGTDSSLICSVLSNINDAPVHTFTIGFEEKEFDESTYAEKVAKTLKTQHTLKQVSRKDAIDLTANICAYYDQPFAAPSCMPSVLVCREARKMVTVALSGDGGDELFMGYGYYNWYNRLKKINRFGGKAARKVSRLLLEMGDNRSKRAARFFDYPDEAVSWLHTWSQEQYMFTEKEISILLKTPYHHTTLRDEWLKIDAMPLHPYEKISLFDIKNYLADNLLFKMDIASMASGLEVRVPYLDHHLVHFSMNVPLKYKIDAQGEQKVLMKKLLNTYLPDDLVYRKKWGFPAPIGNWLRNDLSFLIDKYLAPTVINKQDIFNSKFIQELVQSFRNGKHFHYKRVWSLIMFQMWYHTYIEEIL